MHPLCCAVLPPAPSNCEPIPRLYLLCNTPSRDLTTLEQRLQAQQPCRRGSPPPLPAHHRQPRPLAPRPGFQMSHLWVPCAPHGVRGGVWQLVCLAAVAAMDAGRKRLYAMYTPGAPTRTPVT